MDAKKVPVITLSRVTPFDCRMLHPYNNWLPQPAVFFCRSLWEKSGTLREEFDNAFDYELWLRMSQHEKYTYAPALFLAHQPLFAAVNAYYRLKRWSGVRTEPCCAAKGNCV